MDSMQLLRDHRADQPELAAEDLRAMRLDLERRLRSAPRRHRAAPRRGLAVGLIAAGAAACVTVGLVTASPAPRASAAAAALLQGAAATARSTAAADGPATLRMEQEAIAVNGDTVEPWSEAYLDRTVTVLTVPAGDGEWTRRTWSLPVRTVFGGEGARAFAQRDSAGSATAEHPTVETSADGSFTAGELGGPSDVFGSDRQALRRLPTATDPLLRALRTADLGAGPAESEPEHVMEAASVVLDSGVADDRLQAAVFTALQQQPGLTVTEHRADLDGRVGTAIGVRPGQGAKTSFQLILDPTTGRYLGHREVNLVAIGAVPAGAVLDATAVTRR